MGNMALREVQPLDKKGWKQFVAELQKEPSVKQINRIHESVESGRKLKVHR